MNVFNRIVMIIGILIWLFVVLVLMVRPLDAVEWVRSWLGFYEDSLLAPTNFYYIYLGVLAAIELLLLILLWLEIRRVRRRLVRITTQSGGTAELGVQSVAQSLEYRIDELAGVRRVETHITSRGRDVEVAIDLDTSPSVNIPVLTDQIVALAHEIVEKQLGVKIHGKVNIRVSHEPYPRGTMPASGAMGEEPVVPPSRPTAEAAPATAPAKVEVKQPVKPAPKAEPLSQLPEAGAAKPKPAAQEDQPPEGPKSSGW